MIVVDVNILIHLFLNGSHTKNAQALYKRDPHWIAPDLWIHEMTNVISTYVKHGGMDLPAGKDILSCAFDYFGDNTFTVPSQDVLSISVEKNISGYDAAYIALAVANKVPLITLDKKLIKQVPEYTRHLDDTLPY